MRKLLILIAFSLIASIGVAQISFRQLKDTIVRRFVYCSTTFTEGMPEIGGGIILDGKYFATCWHVVNDSNRKQVKTVVHFWKLGNNDKWVEDSSEIDYHYKPKVGQYNFSKHKYDTLSKSDFIVLKLKKAAPSTNYTIFKGHIEKGIYAFTCAPTEVSPHLFAPKNIRFFATNDVYDFDNNRSQPPPCIVMYAPITQGASGTPIYDSAGSVMGIVCKAALNFNTLADVFRKDPIVIDAYKNGRVQVIVLRMDYILKRYLKGYLTE